MQNFNNITEILQKLSRQYMTVTLSFNDHKQNHKTAEQEIDIRELDDEFDSYVPKDVQEGIIQNDMFIELYVHTSTVGEYYFAHYDLEKSGILEGVSMWRPKEK